VKSRWNHKLIKNTFVANTAKNFRVLVFAAMIDMGLYQYQDSNAYWDSVKRKKRNKERDQERLSTRDDGKAVPSPNHKSPLPFALAVVAIPANGFVMTQGLP